MQNNSKADNYRLYEQGFYGCKLRTWESLKELQKDKPSGRVIMRYKGVAGGVNWPFYGEPVSPAEVPLIQKQWIEKGARVDNIVFNEEAPDQQLLMQGEIMESINHYSLFWSAEKTRMRKAMQNATQTEGLEALNILKANLNSNSYADLMELLELFPGHVIEFSAYKMYLGSAPRRNTIIWEVRNY